MGSGVGRRSAVAPHQVVTELRNAPAEPVGRDVDESESEQTGAAGGCPKRKGSAGSGHGQSLALILRS